MPKTILLADDSVTIQKVVGIVFATEDYQVTAVDNGEDALRKVREMRPDIVLADAVMPRMNGYELCQAIKADPQLADVPVLLLAGTFEPFDEARARAARADGHIAKPFESHALLSRVREVVEGVAVEPQPQAYPRAPAPSASPPVPPPVPPRRDVPPPFAPPARPAPRAGPGPLPVPGTRAAGLRPPVPGVPRPAGSVVRPPPLPPSGTGPRGASPAARAFAPAAPPRPAAPARPPPPPEPFGFALPIASDDDWSDVSTGEVVLRPAPPAAARPAPAAPAPADGGEAALRLAISQASREVVERIAWEVVPQLAEVIIREHVERLVSERQKR
jgi:CheY-like chemotaxis protein